MENTLNLLWQKTLHYSFPTILCWVHKFPYFQLSGTVVIVPQRMIQLTYVRWCFAIAWFFGNLFTLQNTVTVCTEAKGGAYIQWRGINKGGSWTDPTTRRGEKRAGSQQRLSLQESKRESSGKRTADKRIMWRRGWEHSIQGHISATSSEKIHLSTIGTMISSFNSIRIWDHTCSRGQKISTSRGCKRWDISAEDNALVTC